MGDADFKETKISTSVVDMSTRHRECDFLLYLCERVFGEVAHGLTSSCNARPSHSFRECGVLRCFKKCAASVLTMVLDVVGYAVPANNGEKVLFML